MKKVKKEIVVEERVVMECPYCTYRWTPRVKEPKQCPRCHNDFGGVETDQSEEV